MIWTKTKKWHKSNRNDWH